MLEHRPIMLEAMNSIPITATNQKQNNGKIKQVCTFVPNLKLKTFNNSLLTIILHLSFLYISFISFNFNLNFLSWKDKWSCKCFFCNSWYDYIFISFRWCTTYNDCWMLNTVCIPKKKNLPGHNVLYYLIYMLHN